MAVTLRVKVPSKRRCFRLPIVPPVIQCMCSAMNGGIGRYYKIRSFLSFKWLATECDFPRFTLSCQFSQHHQGNFVEYGVYPVFYQRGSNCPINQRNFGCWSGISAQNSVRPARFEVNDHLLQISFKMSVPKPGPATTPGPIPLSWT